MYTTIELRQIRSYGLRGGNKKDAYSDSEEIINTFKRFWYAGWYSFWYASYSGILTMKLSNKC